MTPGCHTPSTRVQREAPYQASECGTVTHGVACAVDGVRALRHLLVHVLHRVAGDVDARLAVGTGQVRADPLGDAGLRVEHVVVVGRARSPAPTSSCCRRAAKRRRVRDVVVHRAVLDGAGARTSRLSNTVWGTIDAREVVVGRRVELDEDRQELRLLHALGLLDLARALVLLDRLGLELGQLSRSLGVARGELAVDGRGLIEGGLVGRSVDAVLALDFLAVVDRSICGAT